MAKRKTRKPRVSPPVEPPTPPAPTAPPVTGPPKVEMSVVLADQEIAGLQVNLNQQRSKAVSLRVAAQELNELAGQMEQRAQETSGALQVWQLVRSVLRGEINQ